MSAAATFSVWVIFDHPKDYPRHFVVRRCVCIDGAIHWDSLVQLADTLDAARELVPRGLFRAPPQPGDDPVIVETWF